MKRLLYILLLLTLCIRVVAQQMPISVTPIMTPPYTSSLSKMCTSGSTSLMINVYVNDLTVTELPVRLHLKFESNGITIQTKQNSAVAPIFLGGGEARVLMGDDLAQTLNIDNLEFKGYDKATYLKTGALPGGLWKVTAWLEYYFQGADKKNGRVLSNKGQAMAWIAVYPPPVLTSPKAEEHTPSDASLPLTFTWNASKFTGGTASLMYTLELWEMRGASNVPAQSVVSVKDPIYTIQTTGLSHTLIPASLALEPGLRYCWRVTVSDPSGQATIQDGGHSEVRAFQYLEKCPDVCAPVIELVDTKATTKWEYNKSHILYNVEKYNDEGTYHETLPCSDSSDGGMKYDYGTTWHVRVQGECKGGLTSEWSDWVEFKIPEKFAAPKKDDGTTYECGETPQKREITNKEEKAIEKGDIVESEQGTTKYEIYSATKNDDGSYRGLAYTLLNVWDVKILCEYDQLRVNTDGVAISNYSLKSVEKDLLMVDPEKVKAWTEELALDIAGTTYNNTIKETIKIEDLSIETIVYKDGKYYAVVKDENGKYTDPVDITSSVDNKKRVAIEDKDGKQLVIDKNGEVMGVEEYKACGGSKLLLNENIKQKDASVKSTGNVKFYGSEGYLFDSYDTYESHSASQGYAKRFPSIGDGNYRPAYACVESKSDLKITAKPFINITFKTERGVPVVCDNGVLSVQARGDRDTTAVYAYNDNGEIVGKVNIMSYDKVTRKVCLVPVGNSTVPDAIKMKAGLDEIFAKLMVDFEVTIADAVNIEYSNGKKFTHGGSGRLGVYNDDQQSAIDKLKSTSNIDDETCYLFLVQEADQYNDDDTPTSVGGYMPRGYQFGFIYKELNNTKTMAHELSHGAFHLRHTFDTNDYLAPEGSTDNLMDYAGINDKNFNHWQWQDIHQPKSVRFKWAQDEQDAEWTTDGHYYLFSYLCLLMDLGKDVAEQLGSYAEFPDSKLQPNGSMSENDTWLRPALQQRNHALTGGYHGVELAATAYAITHPDIYTGDNYLNDDSNPYEHFLLHRFGDCFAHFDIKNDKNGFDDVDLNKYINAFENYINSTFSFQYVGLQNMMSGTRTITMKPNHFVFCNDGRILTTADRRFVINRILSGIFYACGRNVVKSGSTEQDVIVKGIIEAIKYKIASSTKTTIVPLASDAYDLYNYVYNDSKNSKEHLKEYENIPICFSSNETIVLNYEYNNWKEFKVNHFSLKLGDVVSRLKTFLPQARQNDYNMYGDRMVGCHGFTLGHAIDGSKPDDIISRSVLFRLYLKRSIELLSLKYKIDQSKQDKAYSIVDSIVTWCEDHGYDGARLDGVFSLLKALLLKEDTFSVPIKWLPEELKENIPTRIVYSKKLNMFCDFSGDANKQKIFMEYFLQENLQKLESFYGSKKISCLYPIGTDEAKTKVLFKIEYE